MCEPKWRDEMSWIDVELFEPNRQLSESNRITHIQPHFDCTNIDVQCVPTRKHTQRHCHRLANCSWLTDVDEQNEICTINCTGKWETERERKREWGGERGSEEMEKRLTKNEGKFKKKKKKQMNQFNLHKCRAATLSVDDNLSRTILNAYSNGPERPDHFTIFFYTFICLLEYIFTITYFILFNHSILVNRRKKNEKKRKNTHKTLKNKIRITLGMGISAMAWVFLTPFHVWISFTHNFSLLSLSSLSYFLLVEKVRKKCIEMCSLHVVIVGRLFSWLILIRNGNRWICNIW